MISLIHRPGALQVYEYASNIYIVGFDFERRVAVLQDDLDPTTRGALELSFDELEMLLRDFLGSHGG